MPKRARAKRANARKLPCYIRNQTRKRPAKKLPVKKTLPLRKKSALKKKSDPLARKRWVDDVIPQELHEKVVEIISNQLCIDKDQISNTSSLVDDLHADDLDLLEIIIAFEDEFGVTIPYEERKVKCAIHTFSYSSNGYYTTILLIGDTVGEIEQYLLAHKSVVEP